MQGNDDLDIMYGVEVDADGGWVAWARRPDGVRVEHGCVTQWGAEWKAKRLAQQIRREWERWR